MEKIYACIVAWPCWHFVRALNRGITCGSFCFVLSPKGEHYEVIENAYAQGIMQGEMIKLNENGDGQGHQDFVSC